MCSTKYPILLVHGVFFRDFKHFNYWGRIPRTLESRGAKIYYGEHQSALAIENNVSKIYNTALKELGDETPDFMAAVTDLTNKSCIKLNEKLAFPSDIYTKYRFYYECS